MRTPLIRVASALAGLALLVAACGDDDDTTSPPTTESGAAMVDEDMDMDMDMGVDDGATPADEIEGATLRSGSLVLLATTAADASPGLVGDIFVATGNAGTTATVRVDGLMPNTSYVSHLHAGSCADTGGAHFKFDPAGGDTPPNEVHLLFTTDVDGYGEVTVTNEMAADDAASFVMHAADNEDKIACADLGS